MNPGKTSPAESVRLTARTRVLLTIASALLAALLVPLFWGASLDHAISDTYFRVRGAQPAPPDIVIVGIDDPSFTNVGLQWPWPREIYAELLGSVSSARVIVFDVLFDTAGRDGADEVFARAIAAHPGVIVLSTARIITDDAQYLRETWLDPVAPLREATPHVGSIELPVDADGVVRRAMSRVGDRATLGYLAARQFAADRTQYGDDGFAINFLGPSGTFRTLSFYDVLKRSPGARPDPFMDKLVLVGVTSGVGIDPNSTDRFRTPFSTAGNTMPGVEIHANVAYNLLAGTMLRQLPLVIAWPLGVMLAIVCGLLFFRLRVIAGTACFAALVVTGVLAGYLLFSMASLQIQVATLLTPMFAVFLTSFTAHYYETFQNEKRNRILLERSEGRIREILAGQQPVSSGNGPVRVFLSYSHRPADTGYMAEILDYVKGLEKEGIEFWTDDEIVTGDFWDREIMRQLEESDIALTLVSQSYLDSEYCNKEIEMFLARDMVIIPVILSPCEWERHAWLQERQFIPGNGETISEHYGDPGRRKRVYLEIREGLRTQAERLRGAGQVSKSPA